MKKMLLTFLLALTAGLCNAQSDYTLIGKINVDQDSKFSTDYLGNIYVYKGGDLTKYDKSGNQVGIYSTRDYGSIGYVDASNPLKILVVFPDFSKAVILDAGMSANSTLDLYVSGQFPVSIICMSRDEGYWIYDESLRRIRKVDSQLNVIAEGTDLSGMVSSEFRPDLLQESSQWVFLHDQVTGIIVLDRYGTYFKTVREENINQFQADGHNLIYLDSSMVVSIDVRSMIRTTYSIPDDLAVRRARLAPNRLYLLSGHEIRIYGF